MMNKIRYSIRTALSTILDKLGTDLSPAEHRARFTCFVDKLTPEARQEVGEALLRRAGREIHDAEIAEVSEMVFRAYKRDRIRQKETERNKRHKMARMGRDAEPAGGDFEEVVKLSKELDIFIHAVHRKSDRALAMVPTLSAAFSRIAFESGNSDVHKAFGLFRSAVDFDLNHSDLIGDVTRYARGVLDQAYKIVVGGQMVLTTTEPAEQLVGPTPGVVEVESLGCECGADGDEALEEGAGYDAAD